jgi:arylsulfatase A-like enzyme
MKKLLLLLLIIQSSAVLALSNNQVFAYAEAQYPGMFAGPATAGTHQKYAYQFYPASGYYLGIDDVGRIAIQGSSSQNVLTEIGSVADYLDVITAWEAELSVANDRVFAYAEMNYPSIFSGVPSTGTYQQFHYRYYPDSGNYLAIDTHGRIFMLGPYTTNMQTDIGSVADYADAISAWEKTLTYPNILFVIMDDVGIDQMKSFGYGGLTAPAMTNIDQIASNGIRFRNTWSMPACSPSRAVLFEGRFPLRTQVNGALGPEDIANSMVSPFEMTVPKLLKQRNYQSALFGKFHLGLQGNSPYSYGMPKSLGWDYYFGWLDETGDPSSIDTTAGGVGAAGTYSCGFVPGAQNGGADTGACYTADNSCSEVSGSALNPPGRACRDNGGIFDPGASCQTPRPANINFNVLDAHYVSPLVINHEDGSIEQVPLTDKRARTFRGVAPVDAAIDWIKQRPKDKPWMATVSFATVHTPLQQPPLGLLPAGSVDTNGFDCANTMQWPVLSNQMTEALDTEVGRLLIETGIASRDAKGALQYSPEHSDTMIVLVGDNGTLGYTVKQPFDPQRAKGTAYQTGVWVPLIVAGPLVKEPNRDVTHMTNIADIYQLFGEMARIDVKKTVERPLDSVSMLPYLTNPQQSSIRKWNYTDVGLNKQANGSINGPCQFSNSCSHIPVSKAVCEDNGGVWWGVGANPYPATAGPAGLTHCCDVQKWLHDQVPAQATVKILPQTSVGIRNDDYKLVRNTIKDYDPDANACVDTQVDELYQINENSPLPKLDKEDNNLLDGRMLTSLDQLNYQALLSKLAAYQNGVVDCEGDGNLDLLVDEKDIAGWQEFSANGGKSSWYDINLDGLTNEADLSIIQQNMGMDCGAAK